MAYIYRFYYLSGFLLMKSFLLQWYRLAINICGNNRCGKNLSLSAITVVMLLPLIGGVTFAQTNAVTGFILWNSATNRAVGPLNNGAIINLQTLPNFTIVATTPSGFAGSVVFGYQSNSRYRLENTAPFVIS